MAQQFGIKGLFTTGMSAGNFFVNDAAREIRVQLMGEVQLEITEICSL